MKKLLLTLTLGTIAFGTSSFETYVSPQSDCVQEARAIVQNTADQFGDDLNGEYHELYLWAYMNIYTDCIESL